MADMTPRTRLICLASAVGLFLLATVLLFVQRDVVVNDVRFECASVLGAGGDDGVGYTMVSDEGNDDESVRTDPHASIEEVRERRLELTAQNRAKRLESAESRAEPACDRRRTSHAGLTALLAFPAGVCATLVLLPQRRVEESRRRVK